MPEKSNILSISPDAGTDEMLVLEANDSEGWKKVLRELIKAKNRFNHEAIAQRVRDFLSPEGIKEKYKAVIE